MSENFDFADDDPEESTSERQPSPKQLREYAERMAAENKQLKSQMDELQQSQRKAQLDKFLEDKKLPEKVRGLIGDADPEKWFEEYGDVFAQPEADDSGSANDDTGQQQPQQPPGPSTSPQQVAQLQGVTEVQPGTFDPGSHDDMTAELSRLSSSAKSEDEFLAGLKKMGALGE